MVGTFPGRSKGTELSVPFRRAGVLVENLAKQDFAFPSTCLMTKNTKGYDLQQWQS
jgi:hypothetical protein